MQVGDPEEEIEKVAQAGIRGMVGALGRETISPHVMIDAALHVGYASSQVSWGTSDHWFGAVRAQITTNAITWNGTGTARGIKYRIDRTTGEQTSCDSDGCWPKSICQKEEEVRQKQKF